MKFTELLLTRVVNEQGKTLGHLIDVRCRPAPGKATRGGARISELLYGTGGLLKRLGLREMKTRGIPWKSVVRVEKNRITIQERAGGKK